MKLNAIITFRNITCLRTRSPKHNCELKDEFAARKESYENMNTSSECSFIRTHVYFGIRLFLVFRFMKKNGIIYFLKKRKSF